MRQEKTLAKIAKANQRVRTSKSALNDLTAQKQTVESPLPQNKMLKQRAQGIDPKRIIKPWDFFSILGARTLQGER